MTICQEFAFWCAICSLVLACVSVIYTLRYRSLASDTVDANKALITVNRSLIATNDELIETMQIMQSLREKPSADELTTGIPLAGDDRKVINGHPLYRTGDLTAPDLIKDQNGDVVLDLCILCGMGGTVLYDYPCEHRTGPGLFVTASSRSVNDHPLYMPHHPVVPPHLRQAGTRALIDMCRDCGATGSAIYRPDHPCPGPRPTKEKP